MSKNVTIKIADVSDFNFLKSNVYISDEILRRKIEFGEFIVAEKSNVQVGFLQLDYLWSLVPYIALIGVLPKYQRKGIGKKLLQFTESFLKEKEHRAIYSSSQANEAEPQDWHRHVGFTECGIIAGINEGIGEIFFRKEII